MLNHPFHGQNISKNSSGHIAVCDMSGTTCKVLIKKTEQSKPRALAIHDR